MIIDKDMVDSGFPINKVKGYKVRCFDDSLDDYSEGVFDDYDGNTSDYFFYVKDVGWYRFIEVSDELIDKIIQEEEMTSSKPKVSKRLETKLKTSNNNAKGGNNMAMTMDIGQIISMKVMTSLIDSDKELDLGKLALVQSLSNGGQFQITDVVKAKILSKLSIDDKANAEDLPIEKLVILKMLEEGRFDIMEIIKARLIAKELKD